jgi:murein DD-endopeptidase MepM/ murein hydrolase activator NlpD
MIRLSINLPNKRRLDLTLVKRRSNSLDDPLVPDLGKILRARKGSKISRYFRHVFEHKNIRKIFGANMAVAIVASSFLPLKPGFEGDFEQNIVSVRTTNLTTEKGVRYPVQNIKITQGYKLFHPGIDLDGKTGDLVYSIMAGKVLAVSYSRYNYGNAIIIDHGNNLTSLYAHLSRIHVNKGQEVTTKTIIGEIGASGRASGDHLHLEIRDHNYPINPFSILPYKYY